MVLSGLAVATMSVQWDDVAAVHRRAAASGHPEVTAVVGRPWSLNDFRVLGPDGYYIRVTGWSPDS